MWKPRTFCADSTAASSVQSIQRAQLYIIYVQRRNIRTHLWTRLYERATIEVAARLAKGESPESIRDIRGTGFVTKNPGECAFPHLFCDSFEKVRDDKTAYAKSNMIQYDEHDQMCIRDRL